ncbi:phosphinothricin acetyltransferase [Endobacter medicaginis]|uniref:Phosphinothricin acetyltransferase n=1 Tax=Endobacter medicaginis TaxID=1181271 RepID=A0A839UUZ0_9PROT|nr:GNAT family N-acetyltransferase [Endobacter medicaginis]MBB3173607.1 phosphinothricin acetyltransferase [Endobacter medicaginis]MCX5477182.1 GNAT family N-acetyltransferase [Endobacter medicaginis]
MGSIDLRHATDADLPALLAIANHAITHTTANWSREPTTLDERAAWLARQAAGNFPILVADRAGTVLGYASYGPFHPKDGYDRTVEHSVYVTPDAQGQGLGRRLLEAMIDHATRRGMHAMIGLVAADNTGSLALHRACGFTETARLPEVGFKFGRWLDLVYVHRLLG